MDKEKLEEFIKDHSTREAARHFGCSQTTIRRWVEKYDIKINENWASTQQNKKVLSEAIKNSAAYQKYLDDLREKNKLIKEEKMNQIKICKKCGKEFKQQKGLINFCSLTCRNTKEVTEETKKKISEGVKSSEIYKRENGKVLEERRKKAEEMKELKKNDLSGYKAIKKAKQAESFMSKDFNGLGIDARRLRVLYEQNYKCQNCGLSEWLGQELTLEIEHKNGNHQDNNRENLIALCPNCHSLTTTWRGRNKNGHRKEKIKDEIILEELIKTNFNTRQALINLGMAAKGGNYPRCHRIKKNYEEMLKQLEKENQT